MTKVRFAFVAGCCLMTLASARRPAAAEETRQLAAEVREHQGRPTLFIDARPDAKLCVRFFLREPASWRKLHPEELFVDETGAVHQTPSLASAAYWDAAARFASAVIQFCESRTWAGTDPIAPARVDHPLTRGLSPATVLGGPLAYGPVLLPTDGTTLGVAWTKQGRNLAGLAVKERTAADGSTWTSVFSSTPGLPAAFWRNATRLAGAHVWCEDDEVVLADAGLVAIHSLVGGPRRLLPEGKR